MHRTTDTNHLCFQLQEASCCGNWNVLLEQWVREMAVGWTSLLFSEWSEKNKIQRAFFKQWQPGSCLKALPIFCCASICNTALLFAGCLCFPSTYSQGTCK